MKHKVIKVYDGSNACETEHLIGKKVKAGNCLAAVYYNNTPMYLHKASPSNTDSHVFWLSELKPGLNISVDQEPFRYIGEIVEVEDERD